MNKFRHIALLGALGLALFSSCTKKNPPQLEAIPGNAAFVVALENKQIAKKADLKNLKDYKFFQQMHTQMEEVGGSMRQLFVDKLMEDPSFSGVDIDQAYIFGVQEGEALYFSVALKMHDMATFETRAQELMQMNETEMPAIEDKGSYKLCKIDNFMIAWNKSILFTFSGNYEGVNFEEFFAMPKEKSIVSVPDFVDFQKRPYDIGFWMPYKAAMNLYEPIYSSMLGIESLPGMWKDLTETYVHAYICFEKGEARFSALMTPKASMDAFYTKYPILKKDFDQSILNDFPATSYFALKASLNVQEYFKLFSEIASQIDSSAISMDSLLLNNPTTNTIANALGGDMLLNFYDFAQGPLPIPLAGLCFTVKSEEDFNKLIALLPEGTLTKNGDYYVASTGFMVSCYVAYKNNKVYITDDADAIASFTGKGFEKPLANGVLAETLKKSSYLFYLNLDLETYPENVRAMLQSELGEEAAAYLSYLRPYKDFSITLTNDYEVVMSMKFKDKKENSLKQLLKSVDEVYSSTMTK